MVANYRRVGGRAVFITTVRCRIAYDIVIDVATDPTRPDPRSRSVLLHLTAITPDKALRLLGCSETNGCQTRHTELRVFESETAWPLSLAWRVTR